ncbi:MAG: helix-turn-helix domain-containing protein [Burkholderiaceae bacterium]|nr:helix-turn-helix domain-containing protein [Burkholderiaceae bacterium]
MTTIKNRSRIVEEMQEIFSDLKRAGVINKKQIAQFEALKNLEVKTIQPKAIKQLRTKENLSQAVFAIVLNTSASTIQKWESGEKKPSGPSLKLLSILKNIKINITTQLAIGLAINTDINHH